ncbi:glycosyltransferase family 2 protein [Micromonosporaceae bacterium Da 78-11]
MSARPTVSTVITTFDRPDGLRRTLASVAAQPVDSHEVVVVNDAGPDVTGLVAEAAAVLPVRLITLPANRGLAAARKAGIAAARGEFVAFCDDDDVWLPNHLPVALAGLDGAGVEAVYTTCLVAHALVVPGRPVPAVHRFAVPFDPDVLAVTNLTPVISVVTRRFDPDDPVVDGRGAMQEDWATWLGLVLGHRWRMRHLDVATTVYHRIPAAASMTGAAAATVAGVRRFAAGHRLLHQRWPVDPNSRAGQARWMPHRLYDLVEARHTRGEPVDLYYYEKALPVIAAAVTEPMDRPSADAALAAAVVPQAVTVPRPRSAAAFKEIIW